ncbi:hypothetical protein NDU88_001887 [Pleurodeles waltl]|uniref:Uncharacterized protein n=1 Tax=Pleurodeles waltl TaxID=8319 RepID=A0AAV7V9P6_PLEWA|nr:hypothetical protein NDU88_001887 [Pleurodeles waltl]
MFSNHSAVLLGLVLPGLLPLGRNLHLHPEYLLDTVFVEQRHTHIDMFFPLNLGSVENVGMLWEAFEVLVQGLCIEKGDILRSLRVQLGKWEQDIKELEELDAEMSFRPLCRLLGTKCLITQSWWNENAAFGGDTPEPIGRENGPAGYISLGEQQYCAGGQ